VSSVVPCPTCRRSVEWTERSPWRPFCSERCKLQDLARWADGAYHVAGETVADDDESEELKVKSQNDSES
jgi:endogenous inhibitor of DNA gyrase (YacG/DUF329 family)